MKMRIICDLQLLIMGTSACLVIFFLGISTFFWFNNLSASILMSFFGIVGLIAGIFCLPKWLTIITLYEDHIQIHKAFHKKQKYPYSHYPLLLKGSYFHGSLVGIGYVVDYIIITNRLLSQDELTNINLVNSSKDIIKIRFTMKNYNKLIKLLPPKYNRKLRSMFESQID